MCADCDNYPHFGDETLESVLEAEVVFIRMVFRTSVSVVVFVIY